MVCNVCDVKFNKKKQTRRRRTDKQLKKSRYNKKSYKKSTMSKKRKQRKQHVKTRRSEKNRHSVELPPILAILAAYTLVDFLKSLLFETKNNRDSRNRITFNSPEPTQLSKNMVHQLIITENVLPTNRMRSSKMLSALL
jgi:hypothetical protein